MLTYSPSLEPTRIVSEPAEVEARLRYLDPAFIQDILLEANQRGYEDRLEATVAHAPTAAGTFHWHGFVGALRTAMKEKGLSIPNHKNCPLIVSADKSVALVVMTGNSDTGKEFGNPTNQADKGAVIDEAVQKNIQYQLFENSAMAKLKKGESGTQLWVLLYHVASDTKEIRSEVSLPSSFASKKIVQWSERILLRSIPTDPAKKAIQPLPIAPIDVFVERKRAA
ncbi:MAG: hypothetical protein Q7J80_06025 [Anaerolineales bacterium]|nr:hypothetical protein [Anaerolineales bacterium]